MKELSLTTPPPIVLLLEAFGPDGSIRANSDILTLVEEQRASEEALLTRLHLEWFTYRQDVSIENGSFSSSFSFATALQSLTFHFVDKCQKLENELQKVSKVPQMCMRPNITFGRQW